MPVVLRALKRRRCSGAERLRSLAVGKGEEECPPECREPHAARRANGSFSTASPAPGSPTYVNCLATRAVARVRREIRSSSAGWHQVSTASSANPARRRAPCIRHHHLAAARRSRDVLRARQPVRRRRPRHEGGKHLLAWRQWRRALRPRVRERTQHARRKQLQAELRWC